MRHALTAAAAVCMFNAVPASAQLSSAVDAELMRDTRFTFVSMGRDDVTKDAASALISARGGVNVQRLRLDVDAGLLTIPNSNPAGSFAVTAGSHWKGFDTRLRLMAAGQHDDTMRAIGGATVELARNGAFFALRTSLSPGHTIATRDTVLNLEGDTGATARIPERSVDRTQFVNDVQGGYRYAASRIEVSAMINARIASLRATELSGVLTASARVLAGASIGVALAREPGNDWLGRTSRNASMLFIRMDAARRAHSTANIVDDAPSLRVTTTGETTFSVDARAAMIEIAGDFSDWNPVVLQQTDRNHWEARMPLPAGVYHISMRIDGGPWIAPRGLPSLADDLGGATGIFEIGQRNGN